MTILLTERRKTVKGIVIYVHGKGGNAGEAEYYMPLFPGYDVVGFDYHSETPWEAEAEFPEYFESVISGLPGSRTPAYCPVILIANSIGAYFSMMSLSGMKIDTALFVSPVVDMEGLIYGMMKSAGVTEEELSRRGEIPTGFGETLSWKYLGYVRSHPIVWNVPTHILYGENDNLTPSGTMSAFAGKTGASLTVMSGGEHWFHTEEQMKFLDVWVRSISRRIG